jgi:cytochrome c oxidase cbb3-type subunit III
MRLTYPTCATIAVLAAATLGAQPPPPPPAPPAEQRPAAPPAAPERERRPEEPQFDGDSVQRGKDLLVARCGFCHGSNARGGTSGPDLTRSAMVQEDENGKQLGEFLKVGRPERNMPKFELTPQEVTDLATFLHSTIYEIGNRGAYKILDILTGDPKAGEAFFQGAGRCVTCHSPTADLQGVGAKYEPATLQERMLMPRARRRRGPPTGRGPLPWEEPNAVKATVSPSAGASFTGALVRLTDFDVTIYDAQTKQMRTWLRKDDQPKVVLMDPLQAHVDLLGRWTDTDMRNVTAFLAGLK